MSRIRLAPGQTLVEPAWHDTIEKMRVQGQAFGIAVRQIEVVIDHSAIPIDTGISPCDVAYAGQYHRYRACRNDCVFEIVGADADSLNRESVDVKERRQVSRVEE